MFRQKLLAAVQCYVWIGLSHLEKVRKGVSIIVRGFGDGLPHPLQVFFPGGLQLLQRSLGHVSENEQQDSSPPVGGGGEQLQVDLQSRKFTVDGLLLHMP